jgi:hypothetical protein
MHNTRLALTAVLVVVAITGSGCQGDLDTTRDTDSTIDDLRGGRRRRDSGAPAADGGVAASPDAGVAADGGVAASPDAGVAACGDRTCDASESCTSCATDCGVCAPRCGDGTCDPTETCGTCASDCGACDSGRGLVWPVDCVPGSSCSGLGYPDIDGDGRDFSCGTRTYRGHTGTDIGVTWAQMDAGIAVRAAMDGEVLLVWDGKYDRCPDADEPDCQNPTGDVAPGTSPGTVVCTEIGPYCAGDGWGCYWCFASGNTIIIRHADGTGIYSTTYGHLRRGSILVAPGDVVTAGQKIAEVGSSGNSSGPHLHIDAWHEAFYDPIDPWAGPCGPNYDQPLWRFDPPWSTTTR